jgi:EF-hand domain-containing protein 1
MYQKVTFQAVRSLPENEYIPETQPQWLKYDRQVLRFEAYF